MRSPILSTFILNLTKRRPNLFNRNQQTTQITKNGTSNSLPADEIQDTTLTTKVLANLEEFRIAVSQAQLDGIECLTVNEKLFSYLAKNSNGSYITYGSPGVKVYKEGSKEETDKFESLSAESLLNIKPKNAWAV